MAWATYHPAMVCLARHARRVSLIAALAAAAWLAGCSAPDVPRVDDYPVTGQKKVQALHHWDVLAEDVAARVAERIATWPQGEHPIHVVAAEHSDFNRGFVKLLQVHLLEHGVALSTVPTAVEMQVQTQVVQHGVGAAVNRPASLPTTTLGDGIGVLRDWQPQYGDRTVVTGGPKRTEVLVTTTLTNDNLYLTGTADMYYIEQADAALYVPPPPPVPAPVAKTWKVVTP